MQLLTKSSSAPLLENTCIHFISVILSTRGMNDGKDSYPVFHVYPHSTLAHTVAKLVATKAHRYLFLSYTQPPLQPSTDNLPKDVGCRKPHPGRHSLLLGPPNPRSWACTPPNTDINLPSIRTPSAAPLHLLFPTVSPFSTFIHHTLRFRVRTTRPTHVRPAFRRGEPDRHIKFIRAS